MTGSEAIDIRQLINLHPLSYSQRRLIALCFVVVALDGMDIALMGFIAPALKNVWHVTDYQLGKVISSALIGLAVGAVLAGPLSDRFGRRIVILLSVFFFGLWTLMTAITQNIEQMLWLRFLTGLGLGAAMPNIGTLVAEFSPACKRAFIITVVFCGFTFGAALGGFAASWLILKTGWHTVLILGGVLPLVMLPFLFLYLPESVRFLLTHHAPVTRIHTELNKVMPGRVPPTVLFCTAHLPSDHRGAIRTVLSRDYLFGGLMLCGSYFMGLFVVYLTGSWLPLLINNMGMTVTQAALIAAMYQAGGTIGSLFTGWIMDRRNANLALAAIYFTGGIATVLLGHIPPSTGLLSGVAFCSGFCFNGANTGLNALSASYYPTHARATGCGWMHGIGRIGAILSAFAGAEMLTMGWPTTWVFWSLSIPALLTCIMLIAKNSYGYRPE